MLADYLKSYFQDKELKAIFRDVIGTDQPQKVQPLIAKQIKKHLHTTFKFGNTHAGLYQFMEGRKEDGHKSVIRSELAKYLAEFISIVDNHKLQPVENFFQQAAKKRLWPLPHNILFNLEKSSKDSGWIAKKAIPAKMKIADSNFKKILAHTDWGIKNSIFKNKKIIGIFDWDSLGSMSEPEMVGRAAAQFTADWESNYKITPSPEEGRLFVKEYQKYRGKEFTQDEYKIVSASADYLICIISRFEHAGNNKAIHPYQDLLKACGKNSFLFAEE